MAIRVLVVLVAHVLVGTALRTPRPVMQMSVASTTRRYGTEQGYHSNHQQWAYPRYGYEGYGGGYYGYGGGGYGMGRYGYSRGYGGYGMNNYYGMNRYNRGYGYGGGY